MISLKQSEHVPLLKSPNISHFTQHETPHPQGPTKPPVIQAPTISLTSCCLLGPMFYTSHSGALKHRSSRLPQGLCTWLFLLPEIPSARQPHNQHHHHPRLWFHVSPNSNDIFSARPSLVTVHKLQNPDTPTLFPPQYLSLLYIFLF